MRYLLATLLVLFPILAQVNALNVPRLGSRQNNKQQQDQNQKNNNKNKNNGGNNNNSGKNNTQNGGKNNTQNGGQGSKEDPQTSFTLDPKVIGKNLANNGQNPPVAGQTASEITFNNFINNCLKFPNLPLTDGQQLQVSSCNTNPIGVQPSVDNMPSCKFSFPPNFGTIPANQAFTVRMKIQNLNTGFFANANENYFSAPQTCDVKTGNINGHSHVVIQKLEEGINQTTPLDPKVFAFFKGLNAKAVNGELTADVTNGLPEGAYKISSINSATNHQPVIVSVAQHGALDDAIYVTVAGNGGKNNSQNQGGGNKGNQTDGGNNNKGNKQNQGKGGQQKNNKNNKGNKRSHSLA